MTGPTPYLSLGVLLKLKGLNIEMMSSCMISKYDVSRKLFLIKDVWRFIVLSVQLSHVNWCSNVLFVFLRLMSLGI